MSSDVVSRTLSIHQEHEFLLALERAGLSSSGAQNVIQDSGLAKALVQHADGTFDAAIPVSSASYADPLHPTAAAQIMGTSFHGSHDVEQHFGHKFTAQQRKALKTVPFSAAVLQQCRDTHILVAGAPRSIIDIHGKAKQAFYAKDDPWYGAQAFGQEKVEVRWYLIRKDIVPNSTSKTWRKQLSLMDETETVPAACVLVYAVVLHYLAAGERLRPSIYVSTTDVDSGGSRVVVGSFYSDGLRVYFWYDYRYDDVGVASSRKSS